MLAKDLCHWLFWIDNNAIQHNGFENIPPIKEELHPNQKQARFELYLKIINIFLRNDICIL